MCLAKFVGMEFICQTVSFSHTFVCSCSLCMLPVLGCMWGVIPQMLKELIKTWAPFMKEVTSMGQQCGKDCSY